MHSQRFGGTTHCCGKRVVPRRSFHNEVAQCDRVCVLTELIFCELTRAREMKLKALTIDDHKLLSRLLFVIVALNLAMAERASTGNREHENSLYRPLLVLLFIFIRE